MPNRSDVRSAPAGAGAGRGRWRGVALLRREADFRRVYLSQLISLGGDWFAMIPLLTLLERLTGGALWGALVLAADTLLIAALSPWAGVVVDRVDRRRLMIACDLVSAGFVALLFLVRTGSTAWIAVVALGGVAAVKAFYGPAVNAATPNLVPAEDLLTANALSGAVWGVMLAVGASLGALAAALVGTGGCFAIDVLSYLGSAALAHRIRGDCGGGGGRPGGGVRADLRETLAYARRERRIAALLACKPATGLGNGVLALFPVLGPAAFHVGPTGVSLLFAARGAGALLGPLAGRALLAGHPERLRGAVLSAALTFAGGYALFAVTSWFPLAVLLVVTAHVGGSMNASLSSYGLQSVTTDAVRGRVLSIDFMLFSLALGGSQLAAAGLGGVVEPSTAVLCLSGAVLGYSALWWTRSGALRGPGRPGTAPPAEP